MRRCYSVSELAFEQRPMRRRRRKKVATPAPGQVEGISQGLSEAVQIRRDRLRSTRHYGALTDAQLEKMGRKAEEVGRLARAAMDAVPGHKKREPTE